VADTGDFSLIDQYLPDDSTTNPTLILQAAKNPLFSKIIDDSIEFGLKNFNTYVVDPSKSKKKTK
jgi:transaldolase